MIINHNMNAMTAHRQMGINTGNQGKAIEKLSSGQRINRAGDDAAGLAISEKMRGQIRGLDGASRNAQDGVSLIQTAEGALNETHNILQRMRELSVQGSNDTNVAEDREAITKEMDALMEEIDRISTDTEFNGQKLLDGKFTDKKLQIGANTNQSVGLDIGNMNSDTLLGGGIKAEVKITETITKFGGTTPAIKVSDVLGAGDYKIAKSENGYELTKADGSAVSGISLSEKDGKLTITKDATGGGNDDKSFSIDTAKLGENFEFTVASTGTTIDVKKEIAIKNDNIGEITITAPTGGKPAEITLKDKNNTALGNYTATFEKGKLVGFTNKAAGKEEDFITADELGLTNDILQKGQTITVGNEEIKSVDVSNHESATKSIEVIDNAINKVSSQRADLGALQNRLEHTIATNDNSAENLQAAESRIRDVDMAKEMMNLSKNNVLVQAAQSMLGQANQQPNQVLSLLR